MNTQDFLTVVLPTAGRGFYCAVELPTKAQTFVKDVATLDNTTLLASIGQREAYFALATFQNEGNRRAANALAVRSLFVDIDCGQGKAYATKRLAITALQDFLTTTGLVHLGQPWLVDSGGGVHGYWPFDEDVCIEDWRPVAEAFKRTASRLGLKIDMTVTADAARILRPPGTHNYKYNPPRPVTLKQQGALFALQDIADRLDTATAASPGGPTAISLPSLRPAGTPPAKMSTTMRALAGNSVTYFKNIVVRTMQGTGCGQLQHYLDNAQDDGMEPLWRGMLSLAKVCEDADKAVVRITDAHPYPHSRMLQKLGEIKGPYPCTKIDSENPGICGTCTHWGKITNPLALGREVSVDNAEKVIEIEPTDAAPIGTHLIRPEPPHDFSFGTHGGVYRTVEKTNAKGDVTTEEKLIMPYEFFMVDLLQENETYISRFAAVRSKSVTYVAVPSEVLASKDSTIKCLSAQNIMASFGAGNDQHLYAYVRASVEAASVNDSALRVPPRYGWQPDHSFAVGERVIQENQQGYTFPSKNLRNLINVTQQKGALGDWQRYVQLIQDKQLWDMLGFLGVGFGSPLMEFAGAATPAMMFHACSKDSGRGKTLALQLCVSVWGNPATYPVKPSTSERTMMQRAGLLGSLPLAVDEVTDAQRKSKGEFIPTLVFDHSQGGHKVKGSGAANAELINDLYWRALGIITSNEPAMEKMLTMRDTTSFGELYRMLEWQGKEAIVWTDAEFPLKDFLEHNHGHAGRIYAEWLVNNRAAAQEMTVRCIEKVRKKLNAPDVERFWVAGVGACLAGLILAGPKYANVFDFKVPAIFDSAYAQWVMNARSLMAANVQTAQDLLNSYTQEFHGKFVTLELKKGPMAVFQDNRNVTPQSTRGRVAGRIEYDIRPGWVDYFIELTTFKRYCGERNHGFNAVLTELRQSMVVREGRKDLLAKTGGPKMYVKCLLISHPIV